MQLVLLNIPCITQIITYFRNDTFWKVVSDRCRIMCDLVRILLRLCRFVYSVLYVFELAVAKERHEKPAYGELVYT
jgi:TRAP-type mannitol/chloroaromatic compound transport system permease small subunit